MESGLHELYKIYEANIKMNDNIKVNNINDNPIKVGDILVALYKNKEVRGEVSAVYEDYYILKGKNGSELKITMDNIYEHYPKNRSFENKINFKKPENNKLNKDEIENEKTAKKRRDAIDEFDKDSLKNSPENQVDLSIENVKVIGKVIYYSNIKYSQIEKMFEKGILLKEKHWYSITEKQNEIHIIRNNDKAFEIQPFMNSLISHFMKSQNKLITENYNKIKIVGNNNFSIISNIPPDIKKQLINNIIGLLTK